MTQARTIKPCIWAHAPHTPCWGVACWGLLNIQRRPSSAEAGPGACRRCRCAACWMLEGGSAEQGLAPALPTPALPFIPLLAVPQVLRLRAQPGGLPRRPHPAPPAPHALQARACSGGRGGGCGGRCGHHALWPAVQGAALGSSRREKRRSWMWPDVHCMTLCSTGQAWPGRPGLFSTHPALRKLCPPAALPHPPADEEQDGRLSERQMAAAAGRHR